MERDLYVFWGPQPWTTTIKEGQVSKEMADLVFDFLGWTRWASGKSKGPFARANFMEQPGWNWIKISSSRWVGSLSYKRGYWKSSSRTKGQIIWRRHLLTLVLRNVLPSHVNCILEHPCLRVWCVKGVISKTRERHRRSRSQVWFTHGLHTKNALPNDWQKWDRLKLLTLCFLASSSPRFVFGEVVLKWTSECL